MCAPRKIINISHSHPAAPSCSCTVITLYSWSALSAQDHMNAAAVKSARLHKSRTSSETCRRRRPA
eukprot:3928431-Prymnesium_polylepis.1